MPPVYVSIPVRNRKMEPAPMVGVAPSTLPPSPPIQFVNLEPIAPIVVHVALAKRRVILLPIRCVGI
jgi:hypothetical protein